MAGWRKSKPNKG
jgi:hypothetical protein